jgi:predicted transcriptional regulator
MSDKEAAKKRAQLLKELRAKHQESVDRTQQLLKDQGKIERDISKSLSEKSKTVPEIAESLDLPTHRVLWFLTALKKYNIIEEDGMSGEYVLYKRKEE